MFKIKQDLHFGSNRAIHGFSGTRFYVCWKAMRARCNTKSNKDFLNYGGRGIVVCSDWDNFITFHKDMYESYLEHSILYGEKETTLDRIDCNKNYSVDNCRWLTKAEQNRNTRVVTKSVNIIEHKKWLKFLSALITNTVSGRKNHSKFESITGISSEEFKLYIEGKFQSGMTWNNRGKHNLDRKVWELDHVIPCNQFDLAKEYNRKKCFHYTNYQPLWGIQNRSIKRIEDKEKYA